MKITEVRGILMSYPLPRQEILPFYNGIRTILTRDAMLIPIRTDKGLTGYAPGPAHQRAAEEIEKTIATFLIGRDPSQWSSFDFKGDLELTKTYRAVEIALIDLAAKAKDLPMSELIGGRKRDKIKLYGSAGMYMSPQRFAAE